MKIEMMPIDSICPYKKNPRKNDKAVPEVVKSLKRFGFRQPLVVDSKMVLVVGHTRLLAAKKMGLKEVPVHVAHDLTANEARAYRLMDNRTSDHADWEKTTLFEELEQLTLADPELDITFLGFGDFDFELPKDSEVEPLKEEKFKSIFEIVVECESEEDQEHIYNRLTEEGLKCRVLSM